MAPHRCAGARIQGDDLAGLILGSLEQMQLDLEDDDVLVVAQKIISKAEGRLVDLAQVHPSEGAIRLAKETEKDPRLVEVILRESRQVLRTRPGTIIVEHRLGFVSANAGIDHRQQRRAQGHEPQDARALADHAATRTAGPAPPGRSRRRPVRRSRSATSRTAAA